MTYDYNDNKSVLLYKLLKVYDCNPYYFGTHEETIGDDEQYTTIIVKENTGGKNKRYYDVELVLTTAVKVSATNKSITNINKHLEFEAAVKDTMYILPDDVIKQTLISDIKKIKYLGDIPIVRLENPDTWVSSLLFRVFDIGMNF